MSNRDGDDILRIQASDYDVETGHKLEPEEKPAERVVPFDAPLIGSIDQQQHGTFRTSVAVGGTVADFANGIRTMCGLCKHFDEKAWHKLKRSLEASKDGVRQLNVIREALISTGNARIREMHQTPEGDIDLEHALMMMGVCHPLTEMKRDPVMVHPESTCPPEVRTESAPDGFFEPLNRETDKAGAQGFDAIMRRATGEG